MGLKSWAIGFNDSCCHPVEEPESWKKRWGRVVGIQKSHLKLITFKLQFIISCSKVK